MPDAAKHIDSIDDLTPDAGNANRGTERGNRLLDDSLREFGAGRSILADKQGRIIAGNKTMLIAADMGLPVRVVETDGKELVVVQRTDLDLTDEDQKARRLAYADNRVGELDLDWDPERIAADIADGLDLGTLWQDWEMEQATAPEPDVEGEWQGMPEFDNPEMAVKTVIVHFTSAQYVKEFAQLIGQKIAMEPKRSSTWYPEQKAEDNPEVIDERI